MSEQIDWSKAPEWATRLMRNKYECPDAWADDHKDAIWVTDYKSGTDMIFNLDPSAWDLIENRPAAPSWSGEGLPSVGTVCEMHYCGEWEKTEILCIGVKHVFIRQIAVTGEAFECSLNLSACQFRPIRTPEQIAADDREAAIERACSDIEKQVEGFNVQLSYSVAIRATIEAMIDAGYRKEQK